MGEEIQMNFKELSDLYYKRMTRAAMEGDYTDMHFYQERCQHYTRQAARCVKSTKAQAND